MQTKRLRSPAHLIRHIEQQQALQVVQRQVQQAYNLAGQWAAEELGGTVEEVVAQYEFDGKAFRLKAAPPSE